jgi:D-aminopeptidase
LNLKKRCRLRDLGISIGHYSPGPLNSITDVDGVLVGHSTIIRGTGKLSRKTGPVRTGVTAILPNTHSTYLDRVAASGFVLNGAGEMSGLIQVMEWGVLETPILLTNTHSIGACSDALVNYMVDHHPSIGVRQDVVIPLVGECDDSWLNDIGGLHVKEKHVREALESAKSGPLEEGCVGGGTGMITCDLKAGIGTSSRRIEVGEAIYTLGVLVMSNFGHLRDLRIDGFPIGRKLQRVMAHVEKRRELYGSIIVVLATDAPLSTHQIQRVCRRSALGIGRVGSYAAHGSGEIVIGFSTGNKIPREALEGEYDMKVMLDRNLNRIYEAAVETTEEAILNSICMATDMEGIDGHFSHAIPLDLLQMEMQRYYELLGSHAL